MQTRNEQLRASGVEDLNYRNRAEVTAVYYNMQYRKWRQSAAVLQRRQSEEPCSYCVVCLHKNNYPPLHQKKRRRVKPRDNHNLALFTFHLPLYINSTLLIPYIHTNRQRCCLVFLPTPNHSLWQILRKPIQLCLHFKGGDHRVLSLHCHLEHRKWNIFLLLIHTNTISTPQVIFLFLNIFARDDVLNSDHAEESFPLHR